MDTLPQDDIAQIPCHSVGPFWYRKKAPWEDEPNEQATLQPDPSFHCSQHEQAECAENLLLRNTDQRSGCKGKLHKFKKLRDMLAARERDSGRKETRGSQMCPLRPREASYTSAKPVELLLSGWAGLTSREACIPGLKGAHNP